LTRVLQMSALLDTARVIIAVQRVAAALKLHNPWTRVRTEFERMISGDVVDARTRPPAVNGHVRGLTRRFSAC
jgi:hypothetical protein